MGYVKKRFYPMIAVIVSLLAVLNAPVLSALVLCFGEDGHLELEYSSTGKCGSIPSGINQQEVESGHNELSCCETCTDVSLGGFGEECLRNSLQKGALLKHYSHSFLPNFISGLSLSICDFQASVNKHPPYPSRFEKVQLLQLRSIRILV